VSKFIIIAFPKFTDHTIRITERAVALPDVQVALVTATPFEDLQADLREKVVGHWRVGLWDMLEANTMAWAVTELSKRHGPVDAVFSPQEHCQGACAVVREWMGISGMSAEATKNFRDKQRMKDLLRAAGIPCAKSRRVCAEGDAWDFVNEIGLPVVIKPVEGAASAVTFRVDTPDQMRHAMAELRPSPDRQAIIEEFIIGQEHSIDTFTVRGEPVFHTITDYYPSCLEVMRNDWIQWNVVLPKDVEDPKNDDIRDVAFRTLEVLGMDSGMSHLEWFRKPDGSIRVSEVGARPPGAQFTQLVSYHADFDSITAWLKLMLYHEFDVPQRRYSTAIAYLRGQGNGTVKAVHGFEQMKKDLGSMICLMHEPKPGDPKGSNYEGEGYVIVRHPDAEVAREAVKRVVTSVKIELG
jgi:formate-dependent phosphoribosylglycinamide formyltransferase (GAR transformylase)